ncbi:retinoschisin-like [Amphiura filiformis]|uniref:retinoschisin-like n=1 Tax=Amphiura filiformis TaxID=82378 RepID=UPI003B224035
MEGTTSEETSFEGTTSETTSYQTSLKETSSQESTTLAQACSQPMALGMESGSISDAQLSASSYYVWITVHFSPSEGRLNNDIYWASKGNDMGEWFQVDFLSVVTVTEIITQGTGKWNVEEWVTELRIEFGDSASTLLPIRNAGDNMIFTANTDQYSEVPIFFPEPITTKILRIIPTAWQKWRSLRLEVVGCN